MRGLVFPLVALMAVTSYKSVAEPISVGTPDVLPLALDDSFQVVKVFTQTVDPEKNTKGTTSKSALLPERKPKDKAPSLKAEIDRRYFGAINLFERRQREGNYFTVQCKSPKGADFTVRLEYRQQKLGNHVQALDVHYPASPGAVSAEFSILGDDYYQDGSVVAWRVALIQNGRIVGVQQSFLW